MKFFIQLYLTLNILAISITASAQYSQILKLLPSDNNQGDNYGLTDNIYPNQDKIYPGSFNIKNYVKDDDQGNLKVLNPSTCEWITFGGTTHGVYGVNSLINAIVMDDMGRIFIGGSFTMAGNTCVSNIAMWDGTSWSDLDGGVNSTVLDLVIDNNGDLIVGGSFVFAGGIFTPNLAKWDGASWTGYGSSINSAVSVLAIDSNNDLYIGGFFTSIDGMSANRIAKWDGTSWSTLGIGLNNSVNSIGLKGGDSLYVGGRLTEAGGQPANGIALWDGSNWSSLGSGVTFGGSGGQVHSIAIDSNQNVIAGGFFWEAGGSNIRYVAEWNGTSWSSIGTFPGSTISKVGFDASGVLYAGSGNLYVWDGTNWSLVGGGIPSAFVRTRTEDFVFDNNEIYTVGQTSDGGDYFYNFTKWDGLSWNPVGNFPSNAPNRNVRAVLADGDSAYVAGAFGTIGDRVISGIAKWNGIGWDTLANGISGTVFDLAVDGQGNLYAVGSFIFANGSSGYNRVAKWDGTSWSQLGTGLNGNAFSVACHPNGDIYVGGQFTQAGGLPASRIAKWDGTSWSAVGSGLDNLVYDLAIDNDGNLIAGGAFNNAGVQPMSKMGKWDGTDWSALGTGMNSTVFALTIRSSGEIIAGGRFTTAGGITAPRIAKWDGVAWSALGSLNSVQSLSEDLFGNLYAGQEVGGISKWDGSTWQTIEGNPNEIVYSIDTDHNGGIYAGGRFTKVDDLPSLNFAYYKCPEVFICDDVTIYLDHAGLVNLDTSAINCNFGTADEAYITRTSFDCSHVDDTNIIDTLVVINTQDTAYYLINITVLDTISPTATCEDITTYLDSFGLVTVSPIDIPYTTDDNCAANLIRVFEDDYDCNNIGDNQAIFETIDPSGNTGQCPLTITVVDSFPPFTDCKNLTIYLDDIGFYFLSTDDIDSITHLTYDNCSIDSIGISQQDFSCADMPSTIATLTFKDQSGNISTCDVTVTVLDTFPPVLTCTNLTRDIQSNQMVDIIADDAILLLDDNCGIDTTFLSQGTFTCVEANSVNQVLLTAIDSSGNQTNCMVDVSITDTHGYCCPDSLIVNYNPIDSTNYYAADSICSNGQVASGTSVNFRSTIVKIDTSFQIDVGGIFQVINEDCNE